MQTSDVLKQLEINYGVLLNDLEFASHELDARMKDAARYVGITARLQKGGATAWVHEIQIYSLFRSLVSRGVWCSAAKKPSTNS